jgi:hypothetical protein
MGRYSQVLFVFIRTTSPSQAISLKSSPPLRISLPVLYGLRPDRGINLLAELERYVDSS